LYFLVKEINFWVFTEPFVPDIFAYIFFVLRFVFEERDEAAHFSTCRFSFCISLLFVHSYELRAFSQILALKAVFGAHASLIINNDDLGRVNCVSIIRAGEAWRAFDSATCASAGICTVDIFLPDCQSFVATERSDAIAGDIVHISTSDRSHCYFRAAFVVSAIVGLAPVPEFEGRSLTITCDPV